MTAAQARTFWVDLDDAPNNGGGDLQHFNAAGQLLIGQRLHQWYANPISQVLSVLGTDAIAWWDAESGLTLAGSEVSAWQDRVAGITVTQTTPANRPTYSATAFDGRPAIVADGINDQLTATTGLSALPTGSTQSWTWILGDQQATFASDAGAARGAIMWGNSSTPNQQRRFRRSFTGSVNAFGPQIGTGIGTQSVLAPGDYSGRKLAVGKVLASTIAANLENSADATASGTAATGTVDRLALFSLLSFAYWQGSLRDVIVTRSLASEKEISSVPIWRRVECWTFEQGFDHNRRNCRVRMMRTFSKLDPLGE